MSDLIGINSWNAQSSDPVNEVYGISERDLDRLLGQQITSVATDGLEGGAVALDEEQVETLREGDALNADTADGRTVTIEPPSLWKARAEAAQQREREARAPSFPNWKFTVQAFPMYADGKSGDLVAEGAGADPATALAVTGLNLSFKLAEIQSEAIANGDDFVGIDLTMEVVPPKLPVVEPQPSEED